MPIRNLQSFFSTPALIRFAPVYQLMLIYLAVGSIVRLVLWWKFGRDADVTIASLPWVMPVGVLNDFLQGVYLSMPLTLYILLLPDKWYRSRASRVFLAVGSVATIAGLLFISATEYYFFEEFDGRFNLVAIDYLMYPAEVIGGIRSEYPLEIIACSALIAGLALFLMVRKRILISTHVSVRVRNRLPPAGFQIAIAIVSVALVGTSSLSMSSNRVANELAANGASSFFRAARSSELPYPDHYATRNTQQNSRVLAEFLGGRGGKLTQLDKGRFTRHYAADPKGLGKLNVVVLVEEAFGAEFSKLYGSADDLTPNFDKYAQQSLWFKNMYASGTRTVRGLEAIAASFPPIPSVSILRRPNNEKIATWGSVMRTAGYHSSFLYGGYGYFDNMNYFFSHNGFDVQDRTNISKIRFANVWGVSDEDLFDRALEYYDERHTGKQPFFSIVMTTSNHKPYTFRQGVPGVPASGGGRPAGVRYADFAIGYFLDEAKKHRWFDNTLFVVVADHGARVYGKEDIPLRTYEIPMMIYSPKHVQPRMVETLTGQVDIAPTVLGMLGFEYEAPFFGTNVLAENTDQRIALFSHNYDVAMYRDGKMAVLGLGKKERTLTYDRAEDKYQSIEPDRDLTDLAIAIYQTAYEQFQAHLYE